VSACLSVSLWRSPRLKGPGTHWSLSSTLSTLGGGTAGWPRPRTYFPNAVLAEVFVVAEKDNFAGRGCADAEPVLNLAGGKQVAALHGFENVGGDVGLGGKVSLCEGLLHFLHVNKAQSPLFS